MKDKSKTSQIFVPDGAKQERINVFSCQYQFSMKGNLYRSSICNVTILRIKLHLALFLKNSLLVPQQLNKSYHQPNHTSKKNRY